MEPALNRRVVTPAPWAQDGRNSSTIAQTGSTRASQGQRRSPLTIVGGLMVSQLLTLYTRPVVYLYLDRLRLWFGRRMKSLAALLPSTRL